MKKSIALLFAIIAFVISLSLPSAVAAAPTTNQSVAVFHPTQEKTFAAGKDLFTIKTFTNVMSQDTSGDFSTAEIKVAPQRGTGLLLEKHVTDVEDNLYALEGEFEFFGVQPNRTVKVRSGEMIRIPAGKPYGFRSVGADPGKVLLITSKGFGNFIEEIGTPVTDSSSIPTNITEPNIEKAASVARKYGIQFLN